MSTKQAGSDNTSSVNVTSGQIVTAGKQAVDVAGGASVAQLHGPRHADRARLSGQRNARGPQKVRGSFLTV
jgi:hypothetical protein